MTTIHFNIEPGTHSNTGMILNYYNGQANWQLEVQEPTSKDAIQEEITDRKNLFEKNYHIWSLLEDFYEKWNFYDAENRLWFMAKQIIANEDKEFIAEERNEIADFYEKLKGVIQGAGELYEQYKEHSK